MTLWVTTLRVCIVVMFVIWFTSYINQTHFYNFRKNWKYIIIYLYCIYTCIKLDIWISDRYPCKSDGTLKDVIKKYRNICNNPYLLSGIIYWIKVFPEYISMQLQRLCTRYTEFSLWVRLNITKRWKQIRTSNCRGSAVSSQVC